MGREEQVAPAEIVRSERRGAVLVIVLENPPTAALSAGLRTSLLSEIDQAARDDTVRAVVITGADGDFATGAGLTEDVPEGTPSLAELCDRVEALTKPVVVAIGGPALGGGLELALAAHLRVATPISRLGAPDITLGLVPNAGGTQRLPKIIGGIAALKLLLSGRAIPGSAAKKLGLVDVIAEEDLLDVAVDHAERLSASEGELRRSSTRRDRMGEGAAFLEAVAGHRKAAEAAPLDAPTRMIECVEASLLLPYEIGRGLEEAAYDDLVSSEHSKALRYIFAAERRLNAATRWVGRVESRAMSGVTVVGARGVAAEVAVQCLDAGFVVTVAEVNEEAMEDGVGRIIGHFDARVASGSMTEEAVEQVLDRMHAVAGYESVAVADVVIDPAPLLTKARVRELDASMKAGAVLLLGSEKVAVGTVAAITGRTPDVVGMRFFPGVRKNRLVELTVTDDTGPKAVATARALARKLDRLIVETAPSKEAVGTRLLEALHAAADLCLEDGAGVPQIDAVLKTWGLPFGSFAWRDLTGIQRACAPRETEGLRGGGIDPVLVSMGRLGVSTGHGYYAYRERGRPGEIDGEVERMISADRIAKEVATRALTDDEIRDRCIAAMAGAGAQALMEGVVNRAEDIDMIAVHGLGFARRSGGVMFAADLMGLKRVQNLLAEMSEVSVRVDPPATLIAELIASGERFTATDGGAAPN